MSKLILDEKSGFRILKQFFLAPLIWVMLLLWVNPKKNDFQKYLICPKFLNFPSIRKWRVFENKNFVIKNNNIFKTKFSWWFHQKLFPKKHFFKVVYQCDFESYTANVNIESAPIFILQTHAKRLKMWVLKIYSETRF